MTDTQGPDAPRAPDIGRRTLTPFGYAVCALLPILIAAVGFTYLHFHYDQEDLVSGTKVPILTSDWTPDQAGSTALLRGEVTLGDDDCVRVGDQTVVWPKDYEATVQRVGPSDQVKVYDPDRDIVARSSQTIEVGGGYGDLGEYAGRTCAPDSGDIFYVQSQVKVVGAS
jgi:hypothetical protein